MSGTDGCITVENHEEAQRSEAWVSGHLALIQYEWTGDQIVLIHTEVPQALVGRGIANRQKNQDAGARLRPWRGEFEQGEK